jgi:hypothetical protein
MKRNVVVIILLLLLFLPAVAASAAGYGRIISDVVNEDVNVFRNDLLVEEEGRVNGNVTVFSGEVDVAGVIDGDLSVFGGDATVSGSITGNLVIFGGDLVLTSDARVGGDCFVGGAITDESSVASCTEVGSRFLQDRPWIPSPPQPPELPPVGPGGSALGRGAAPGCFPRSSFLH